MRTTLRKIERRLPRWLRTLYGWTAVRIKGTGLERLERMTTVDRKPCRVTLEYISHPKTFTVERGPGILKLIWGNCRVEYVGTDGEVLFSVDIDICVDSFWSSNFVLLKPTESGAIRFRPLNKGGSVNLLTVELTDGEHANIEEAEPLSDEDAEDLRHCMALSYKEH